MLELGRSRSLMWNDVFIYFYAIGRDCRLEYNCNFEDTVWPEILAGNLFWRIGGFESNPPIFHPPKTSQCDVIIIAKS